MSKSQSNLPSFVLATSPEVKQVQDPYKEFKSTHSYLTIYSAKQYSNP